MNQKRTQMRLDSAQMYQVMELVRTEYATTMISDDRFAEHATRKIGVPVSFSSIETARSAFKIPATRDVIREQEPVKIIDRIKALEDKVAALETRLTAAGG